MKLGNATLAFFALGLAAACGHGAVPTPAVTEAKSAISAADAVGAQNNPQARLHLKMANDQTQQAEAAIRDGENDKAHLLLQRAKADADLALVMTRESEARQQAMQAMQRVNQLEQHQQ